MPWVRIDDEYAEHPKLASVGPLGHALWLAGLAYCNRNMTDGFIPWGTARSLLAWEFLGAPEADGRQQIYHIGVGSGLSGRDVDAEFVIELLLGIGLWAQSDNGRGYWVHDYGDYQPLKEQLETERAQKQAAGKAGGMAAAKARATAGAIAKSKPVPGPGINSLGDAGRQAGRLSPETVPESGDYPGARAREDDPLGVLDRPSIGRRFDRENGQPGKPASPSKNSRKKTTEHERAVR
jgi:hypothetical protein